MNRGASGTDGGADARRLERQLFLPAAFGAEGQSDARGRRVSADMPAADGADLAAPDAGGRLMNSTHTHASRLQLRSCRARTGPGAAVEARTKGRVAAPPRGETWIWVRRGYSEGTGRGDAAGRDADIRGQPNAQEL